MSRPGFRRILRGAAPALILLLAMACDDDDPTPRALTSTTPDPVCAGSPPECTGNADIAFSVAERYSADELVFTLGLDRGADGSTDEELDVGAVLGGTHPDYEARVEVPIGPHALTVTMIDGNSETHELQIPFEVIDCRAPSPICINGLALSLQPLPPFTDADGDGDDDPGAMTVFATDLIASPTTDCTPPVRYSINRVGEPASVESPSLVVTCDDPETLLVEVHAWDETPASAGGPLHDYCETYILVQDPQQLCPE